MQKRSWIIRISKPGYPGSGDGEAFRHCRSMGNVLEDVTIGMYPVIENIKDEMKKAGALNAMMSGSGPTVFGMFESRRQAQKSAGSDPRKALAKQVYVTNVHGARRIEYGTEIRSDNGRISSVCGMWCLRR